MNHPPIPPKSRFFNAQYDFFRLLLCDRSMNYWLDKPGEDIRPIIAAVAEVEWRKRAARWEQLIDALWNRWYPGISDPLGLAGRKVQFRASANECYANARAWRAWGEGKEVPQA